MPGTSRLRPYLFDCYSFEHETMKFIVCKVRLGREFDLSAFFMIDFSPKHKKIFPIQLVEKDQIVVHFRLSAEAS